MQRISRYITLGIGHGINDCIAGFVIGWLFYQGYSPIQLAIYTLLYNVLAFGGQLVFANLIEKIYFPKKYLLGSFFFLFASLSTLNIVPELAILFSGIASAVIHVTGGLESTREDDKSFGIGIFASPGIVGLILGGYLAYSKFDFVLPGIIACSAYILYIFFFYRNSEDLTKRHVVKPALETHDLVMCILITAICMRSFIWDVIQLAQFGNFEWLAIIAIAAMAGKVTGGILSDRFGHSRYSMYALILSIPFLTLLKKYLLGLSIGAFLLQSTIPGTTVMILQHMRQKPAIGVAISFGISVLIAVLLFSSPAVSLFNNNFATFNILMVVAVLVWTARTPFRIVKQKLG